MEPVTTAALIGAGVSAASSGANALMTGNLNKKNRAFAVEQYERQKEDELAFWRQNNEYNHPTSQMSRLQEAGLNPHLVYGNGTVANSSSAPSAPAQAKWQGTPPQIDSGGIRSGIDQIYNLQAKKAQTDNLRAQNTLLRQDAILKALEGKQKVVDINTSTLGFEYDKESFQRRLNTIDATIDRIRAEETSTLDANQRAEQLQPGKLESQSKTIQGQSLQNALKAEHLKMRKMGIEPGDKIYFRMLNQIYERYKNLTK